MPFSALNRHVLFAAGFAAFGVGLLAHSAAAQTTIYDNTNDATTGGFTFDTVQSITTGTSPNQKTDIVTSVLADDITPIAGYSGASISSIEFVAYNNTGHDVAARPILYVWTDNGGQPGTLLNSVVLQTVGFYGTTTGGTADGNIDPVILNLSSAGVNVPTATTFWLGIQLDNNYGAASGIVGYPTATAADFSNLGLEQYASQVGPPTAPAKTGSSADRVFESNDVVGLGSNPAGTIYGPSQGVSNFGYQVNVVGAMPEPGSLLLVGPALFPLVGVALSARRRKGCAK